MSAVLAEERRLNECLQDMVDPVFPPRWPSSQEEPIDIVEPIGFAQDPILRGSSSIRNQNFRITGGQITIQIILDRCMNSLIAAALAQKPIMLPLTPDSIPRMELNLLDSFTDDMPKLIDLYSEDARIRDQLQLGIGKFIGECVSVPYGGAWHYGDPPESSKVLLGDVTLDPMALARDFLDRDHFDDVSFRSLIDDAELALRSSTSLPTFTEHIDPTPGLEGEGLKLSLAEMWVAYRFVLNDLDAPRIADSIEIQERGEVGYTTFLVDQEFVPQELAGIPGATDSQGRVAMAYLGRTGEFLVLSSRKHFARFLTRTGLALTKSTAKEILSRLSLFRPGWQIVSSPRRAEEMNRHFQGTPLQPPNFHTGATPVLQFSALDADRTPQQLQIRYDRREGIYSVR